MANTQAGFGLPCFGKARISAAGKLLDEHNLTWLPFLESCFTRFVNDLPLLNKVPTRSRWTPTQHSGRMRKKKGGPSSACDT